MKLVIALVVVCSVVGIFGEEYPTKNINLDEVLANDRLLQSYIDCVLDKGECTPDGEQLKGDIKEALEDECAKCNDQHKEGVKKVVTFLTKNKPEVWKELSEKYDPEGKYKEKYADLLKKLE